MAIHRKPYRKSFKGTKKNGTYCSLCGERIYSIPFECRRCKKLFCSEHRLPEAHNCKPIRKLPVSPPTENPPTSPVGGIRIPVRFPRMSKKIKLFLLFTALSFIFSVLYYNFRIAYLADISWLFVYLDEIIVLFVILKKMDDISIDSTLRLWGLRILSGIFILSGVFFIIAFGFASAMMSSSHAIVFTWIFGFGLILIGLYLEFKFRSGSGLIVWHGA